NIKVIFNLKVSHHFLINLCYINIKTLKREGVKMNQDQPTILIVEDEQKLSRVLQLKLEYENYQTEIANNGKDALELITEKEWDLVLLDIMLPGLSGVEVLRRVRKSGDLTPIILLTARDEVHDKVNGLDQGANDYVTKPFQIEELLARIRVHLR